MKVFRVKKQKRNYSGLISILLAILVLTLSVKGLDSIQSSNDAEQAKILESSVTLSITACYALEGTYPPDITYLTEHYGLVYDSEEYFIDYQYIGANLRPDVTIIKRND